MSRAYRIRISETLDKLIHLEDGLAERLEILDILPQEQMGACLADALEAQGFLRTEDTPDVLEHSTEDGVTIRVDIRTGQLEARVKGETHVQLKKEHTTTVVDPTKNELQKAEEKLSEAVKARLEEEAQQQAEAERQKLTARLEKEIARIRPKVEAALNQATASALKTRAAQLGEIESIQEDAGGQLLIKVRI